MCLSYGRVDIVMGEVWVCAGEYAACDRGLVNGSVEEAATPQHALHALLPFTLMRPNNYTHFNRSDHMHVLF